MIKWIHSKIGAQLLITVLVVLALSMVSLIYIATQLVAEFGEFSASRNETNIRENANAFLAHITHEQAMRYESAFKTFAVSSAVIAKQAAFLLENMASHGKLPHKPHEKLHIYPHNGIFSNDRSEKTMVLYWGSPAMSHGISEQINTLSHLDPLLEVIKESNLESTACYAVTEPGIARYYPNIHGVEQLPPTTKFDIRNANWYVIAKPENNLERKTVWSNIYLDSVGHGLMITASTPIYSKGGQYLGATGVDVTLDTIMNDILAHIPSCHKMEGMFSFLVDNQGRIIAFPPEYLDMFEIKIDQDKLVDATFVLKHSLLDSSNAEIREIGQNMFEKKYHVSKFFLNGQTYLISSHFMPSTGWRVGTVVPESAILASVQETRKALGVTVEKMTGRFILLTILFLIISILVIAILSIKNFIRPLGKLSKGALRVKEGDLTTHVAIHTKDEIGSLATSFNTMVDTLREAKEREKEYTQTLEQKVKDRTQEIMIKNEDLKKTHDRLELAMDAGENGLWDWNLDTDDIYFSPRYYTMLGYESGELPMELKTWINLMHPDDQKTIVPEVDNYVKNAQPYQVEFRLKTKDGDWRWISGRGKSYEKDADGIPHRAVGVHVDISERKWAEEALRESERNLKAVLGASPVGIGLVVNRKLAWSNETMYRMLGYEQDSLLGLSARVLYPDDEEFERTGKQIYSGIKELGTGQAETRWIRKDGTVFDCIIRLTSLDPSDPDKGQIVAVTDVSELKRANEKLRESDLRYRLLVENANDAIFIAQDKVVKFPNPKAEELTGFSAEELAKMSFVDFIHPEDRDMVLDRHKRRLKGEDFFSTYSFRIINGDGEELWVQLNTVLITWENRPATLNFLRDITEQKNLEIQLQRAQKMEAIGTLAGGVAHDLNNILSGLVGYPELLLMDLPEESPLRKPIVTIQRSGEKAAAIVQDLLTLARRGISISEVVNLNTIISEQLKSPEFKKLISFNPKAQVETHFEKDLLNIKGSTVHLSKTIMNLFSNAVEAMIDGGKLLVSTENLYIDRPIRGYDHIEEGDYVTITISDTGIGISEEDMEKMFEPFYTKKVMGRSGTGLGMSVVWGTVKDHKGYINVESTPRKGTTFTLYFPVTREEIVSDRSLHPIERYMGKGESILVVDDKEEQRDLASKVLNKLCYSVTTVASGEEAVKHMRNNSVALLVLDMIMDPGMDGLEAYKKILELHPGQKAIIASGFSETERVKEAQRLGAGTYVRKPYTLEKIGLAVRKELEK